ncbi:MAG: hypothetical protein OSJ58_09465 [Dysosmobacter sp.]|nr:hypothetical protein [Dysosmobacter sp.]
MKQMMRRLGYAAELILAAVLTGLEVLLAGAWLRGTLYVMKFGALENPYAAEDAEIAGLCALVLLPLWLAMLAWTVYRAVLWWKKRAGARTVR